MSILRGERHGEASCEQSHSISKEPYVQYEISLLSSFSSLDFDFDLAYQYMDHNQDFDRRLVVYIGVAT
jgi:hypothetical protein